MSVRATVTWGGGYRVPCPSPQIMVMIASDGGWGHTLQLPRCSLHSPAHFSERAEFCDRPQLHTGSAHGKELVHSRVTRAQPLDLSESLHIQAVPWPAVPSYDHSLARRVLG